MIDCVKGKNLLDKRLQQFSTRLIFIATYKKKSKKGSKCFQYSNVNLMFAYKSFEKWFSMIRTLLSSRRVFQNEIYFLILHEIITLTGWICKSALSRSILGEQTSTTTLVCTTIINMRILNWSWVVVKF